ncbi:MAG: hypothetical protein ACR2HR_17910 [Euzebya sp.]
MVAFCILALLLAWAGWWVWRELHPSQVLVPDRPTAVTVAFYGPVGPSQGSSLVTTVHLDDRQQVVWIAHQINAFAAFADHGASVCAEDFGTPDTLAFSDASGTSHTVSLQTSGCYFASESGAQTRWPRGRNANFSVIRYLRLIECSHLRRNHSVPCSDGVHG